MRTLFTLFLVAALSLCYAQNKPVELSLNWKGGGNASSVRVNSVSGGTNDIHAVIVNNKEHVKVFWFDSKMQVLKESQASSLNGEDMAGGFIKDGKTCLFFRNGTSEKVHSYVFDMKDGTVLEYDIKMDLQGKKFLGQINTPGNFCFLTADKKEPVISVFDFSVEGQAHSVDFDLGKDDLKTGFSKNDLWKALSKTSGFSRSVDAAVVIPDIECDIEVANSTNKLYGKGDSLILTMDMEPLRTRVFKMSVRNKSLTYDVVNIGTPSEFGIDDSSHCKFNSFLRGNNLYHVLASSDRLVVSVFDFQANKELTRYMAYSDGQIDFKNTPVMQEGGGTVFSQHVKRELEKTKQMLRKMTSGRTVVTAINTSSNIDEVTIGAFKEMSARSRGYMPAMGPGVIGVAGAGVALGGGIYVGPSYNYTWNRATRFKMLVDSSTGKHIAGEASPSINEEIEKYSKDVKIPEGGSTLFKTGNTFRYAYFDKEIKKLVLIDFGGK